MLTDGDREMARVLVLGMDPDIAQVVPGRLWSDGRERLITRNPEPAGQTLTTTPGAHRVTWEVTGTVAARPHQDAPGTAPGSPQTDERPRVRTLAEIHQDRPSLYATGPFRDTPDRIHDDLRRVRTPHPATSPSPPIPPPRPRPAQTPGATPPREDA